MSTDTSTHVSTHTLTHAYAGNPPGTPAQAVCRVFIATSLDGYIARSDGAIDWLEEANRRVPAGEDCGYAAFMAQTDALVMGRATFETVRGFTPWPYDKPVVMMSRQVQTIPAPLHDKVHATTDTPQQVVAGLAARGLTRLYIDGGQLIQSFLRAGLIDEITITTVPVLLGSGRPLFGRLDRPVALEPVASTRWPFGFVQTRWRVLRDA